MKPISIKTFKCHVYFYPIKQHDTYTVNAICLEGACAICRDRIQSETNFAYDEYDLLAVEVDV